MESKPYIFSWNGIVGRILANGEVFFDIEKKPDFSFPYQQLYFNTDINEAYFVTSGANDDIQALNIPLDDKQIDEIKKYLDEFMDKEDYDVQTYDSEYIYRGQMMRSDAMSLGLNWTVTSGPTESFSKYLPESDTWEPVYAVFKEEGYPIFSQEQPMSDDVMYMTVKEFGRLPTSPSPSYALNFVTMTWEDKRDLAKLKFDSVMDVRAYFEHYRTRNGSGRIINSEYATYRTQYEEARDWLKNNDTSTPFLDGFLSINDQLDKKTLCDKIVENYKMEALFEEGKQHGELYKYIYRIRAAETNAEVDEIVEEVFKKIGKYRVMNAYKSFPIDFAKQVGSGSQIAIYAGGSMRHATTK